MSERPRLTPAMADVRRAVRQTWQEVGLKQGKAVAVACSGGPDSLALAAASIFEGKRQAIKVFVVFINHNLQNGSELVAKKYAKLVSELGADLVEVIDVKVNLGKVGMEAAARSARYKALDEFASANKVSFTMLGHTLDDQAETVLLGLARGSGAKSLAGMSTVSSDGKYLRPLLGIRRETTVAFCRDSGLVAWNDPQNNDAKFLRVRVRKNILPLLEKEMGPGVYEALARTAQILREDNLLLEKKAEALFAKATKVVATEILLDVKLLEKSPKALANRVIHRALSMLGPEPSRKTIDSVMALITNWHGQKALTVPAVRVIRRGNEISLKSTKTLKTGAC